MSGHFLPASVLLYPYCCKAEVRHCSRILHLSSPHHCLAAGDNRGLPIDPNILYSPVIGRESKIPEKISQA